MNLLFPNSLYIYFKSLSTAFTAPYNVMFSGKECGEGSMQKGAVGGGGLVKLLLFVFVLLGALSYSKVRNFQSLLTFST